MKQLQKTSVMLLAAILLSSCAQSGDDGKATDAITTNTADTSVVTDTDIIPKLRDNVPELDFDGDTLTFSTNEQYSYEMDVEESVGEITNDAVFERNLMMEERFNIVIDKIVTDTADHYAQANFIRQTVMSGDQSFDVAANYVYTSAAYWEDWVTFRADNVSRMVKRVRDLIDEIRPDVLLSADVGAATHLTRRSAYQDSRRWVEEGWLDILHPMAYGENDDIYVKNMYILQNAGRT